LGFRWSVLEIPQSFRARQGKALRSSLRESLQLHRDRQFVSTQLINKLNEFDVCGFWSRGTKVALFSAPAVRAAKIPLVFDIGTEYKSRGKMLLLHAYVLAMATSVVAQSRFVFTDIFPRFYISLSSHKMHAIVPGLSKSKVESLGCATPSLDNVRHPPVLALIGSICSRKGQLLLIDAAIGLWNKGHDFKIDFVGPVTDQKYYERCKATLECSGHGERVSWSGWIENIRDRLDGCSAVVLCSTSEGMPQVVLESMHFGRPVVSVKVGAVPELIDDSVTGFLAEEPSVKSFSLALLRFLTTSPEHLNEIVRSANERVNRVACFKKWARRYGDLLLSLTKER